MQTAYAYVGVYLHADGNYYAVKTLGAEPALPSGADAFVFVSHAYARCDAVQGKAERRALEEARLHRIPFVYGLHRGPPI